jgi:indolepyruvate ferredoxin oxidoreductase beta subunit
VKQQIIVSGIGGQGVLFLTRVIAQVAVERGIPVLTSENHGMAQRGGTVLSTIKVGDFASPLVRTGQADLGLMLWDANEPVHSSLLKADATMIINSTAAGAGIRIDAAKIAREMGNAVLLNLILLGVAIKRGTIFCSSAECEQVISSLAPRKFVEQNLKAFHKGLEL